jgi:hypothetical protein
MTLERETSRLTLIRNWHPPPSYKYTETVYIGSLSAVCCAGKRSRLKSHFRCRESIDDCYGLSRWLALSLHIRRRRAVANDSHQPSDFSVIFPSTAYIVSIRHYYRGVAVLARSCSSLFLYLGSGFFAKKEHGRRYRIRRGRERKKALISLE